MHNQAYRRTSYNKYISNTTLGQILFSIEDGSDETVC